ncbi:GIY-YIG nuclease family protein [Schaalia hyovaginalis]|uniref:GIY-YIG nuclease family protein n=1 Tax=Schaalia hyovaginalis TaxID=29316 RepID=A0A923IXG3_9ACTO|nr:GIY-YIG nuclease family protein [Schaalia hyovaginalis]MBB6335047.1 hypothetical protein [Schaalia hyovaginalis]MDY2668304.1 GIY-YIG nuclease family protein [Schaalia hyovaginalis]
MTGETRFAYDVRELESVAPIFRSGARGIYVLVFANGERYVGQTIDFTHRFATHRHGGRHHPPWTDIVGVEFQRIDEGDLTRVERETIAQQRALGHLLRNKTWNFDFAGASALDHWIPPLQQEHWSTGGGTHDLPAIESAAHRPQGSEPRLFTEREGRALWAFNEGAENGPSRMPSSRISLPYSTPFPRSSTSRGSIGRSATIREPRAVVSQRSTRDPSSFSIFRDGMRSWDRGPCGRGRRAHVSIFSREL